MSAYTTTCHHCGKDNVSMVSTFCPRCGVTLRDTDESPVVDYCVACGSSDVNTMVHTGEESKHGNSSGRRTVGECQSCETRFDVAVQDNS